MSGLTDWTLHIKGKYKNNQKYWPEIYKLHWYVDEKMYDQFSIPNWNVKFYWFHQSEVAVQITVNIVHLQLMNVYKPLHFIFILNYVYKIYSTKSEDKYCLTHYMSTGQKLNIIYVWVRIRKPDIFPQNQKKEIRNCIFYTETYFLGTLGFILF